MPEHLEASQYFQRTQSTKYLLAGTDYEFYVVYGISIVKVASSSIHGQGGLRPVWPRFTLTLTSRFKLKWS